MTRKFKKNQSFKIMKASEFKVGQSLEGTYLGTRNRQVMKRDQNGAPTGELTDIIDHKFRTDDGELFIIPEDAGFRVAKSEVEMTQDKYYQVNKLDQISVGNAGQKCNQYEILEAE